MRVDTLATPGAGTRRTLAPADLSGFPSIGTLLARLGAGVLLAEGLTAYPGRNDNWAGATDSGLAVFVKHIGGDPAESLRGFRRVMAFERLAGDAATGPVPHPRLIGSDEAARLLVFDLVEDAASGSDLASDDRFDAALAHRAGRVLAGLHSLRPGARGASAGSEALDTSPMHLPPLANFAALPWSRYTGASAGTLEAWRLLQGDTALHDALRDLRSREERAPRTPMHGDMRLDQLLLDSDGRLLLADWEEFRSGDPARDLGGFAGDWLYRAVLKVPSGLAQAPGVPVAHEEVVRTGVAELAEVTPLIAAFRSGYADVRPEATEADPGLFVRATAFAGWHLLDRLLASASARARLTAAERAAAGVGRTALRTPEAFVPVLGWEGPQA